jgi:hypothetical protein
VIGQGVDDRMVEVGALAGSEDMGQAKPESDEEERGGLGPGKLEG